ncbi:MAG: repressor LexA [Oscillospiraceae bacterium]|nr:repressor LexA [Oscillospiraceae bacterium]
MQHKDYDVMNDMAAYVNQFVLDNDRFPTVRELGKRFTLCKSSAQRYLTALKEENRLPAESKMIEGEEERVAWLSNTISCGLPSYQEENIDGYVRLSTAVFGRGAKFLLTASGDSMVDAGIHSGDVLVIRKQVTAQEGEIVVALLNGENTLKRLQYHEDGRPYLHPENRAYADIEIGDEDTFYIQGVLSHVIREVSY